MLYTPYFQEESTPLNELTHHGVLGMKWGVRRFQNADGSLTPAGKKKVSKQYEKLSKKSATEIASKNTKIYVDSYNKTADEYNNGKIDKFNKQYIKKGKTFDDPNYEKEYTTAFEKDRLKNYAKMYVSELEKDENYRKAESLIKQYDMTKFNDLARENTKGREEIEKIITGK